jgi:predicted dehydrogenase
MRMSADHTHETEGGGPLLRGSALQSGSALRVGIIGAGIGAGYVAGFQRQPGVSVAAVCTRTPASGEALARRYGIPHTYIDYRVMLEREPLDVVVVATPNALHREMTLAALDAGAHVVCEKPLALNVPQALEMTWRAGAAGRVHFVPFIWRFVPGVAYVKEMLDAGFIGTPYHVDVCYFVQGWGDPAGPMRWQFDRAQAGSGSLANLGSHLIHAVQWWLGPIARVCALATTAVKERRAPDGSMARVDVDDGFRFLATLEDGTPVSFALSSVAHVRRVDVEIGVFGSEGAIVFQDDWGAEDAASGRIWATRTGDPGRARVAIPPRLLDDLLDMPDYSTPFRGCFGRMAREVVRAVREGRDAAPNFRDGLHVQEVLDACLASATQGQWVMVERHDPSEAERNVARDSVPASFRNEERVEGRPRVASGTSMLAGQGGDGAPTPSQPGTAALQDDGGTTA